MYSGVKPLLAIFPHLLQRFLTFTIALLSPTCCLFSLQHPQHTVIAMKYVTDASKFQFLFIWMNNFLKQNWNVSSTLTIVKLIGMLWIIVLNFLCCTFYIKLLPALILSSGFPVMSEYSLLVALWSLKLFYLLKFSKVNKLASLLLSVYPCIETFHCLWIIFRNWISMC